MTRITPYADGGEVGERVDLTALPIGTRLRTRRGHRARLLANDVRGIEPCVIAVDVGTGYEQLHNVGPNGRISEGSESPHDIVGIDRPKHRVRVQIVSGNGGSRYHYSSDPSQTPGYRTAHGETIIADTIVEIEELAPTTPAPVGDARGEG